MTKNENGSRTLVAVVHPSRFEPFPGIEAPEELELAWERRRPWVFANMAHAAYHPGPWVEEKLAQLGASFVRAYDRRQAQGFLAVWPDKAVIAFRRTQPDLEAHVVQPGIPAYATGHSLGAAMATVAGMLYPFAGVVTFGEPRVGSGVGREFKAGAHTRYVNGDDPVTKVPPPWWPFDYEHHGDEVRIVDAEGPNVLVDHSIVDYSVQLDN